MEQYFERLTEQLMEKNNMLTYEEARTWVELLWSDFETTYAKAGRKYKGQETTERIVENGSKATALSCIYFKINNRRQMSICNKTTKGYCIKRVALFTSTHLFQQTGKYINDQTIL